MPRLSRTTLALTAALLLVACRAPVEPGADVASPAASAAPAPADTPAAAVEGRVAAHYFGRQWPKNFLSGFRREHVAEDFRQLADDGFDTVVLLVSWGDFQPVADPCCEYDERAFERLAFLLDQAREAKLKVMLRLGYGWTFHPRAGDVGERQQQLLNRPEMRVAYQRFLERVSKEVAGRPELVLSFMSWEDQWLRRVDDSARDDLAAWRATLPPEAPRGEALPDPVASAAEFHAYWDWLVLERLYTPALPLFPSLSYEVRIDREPRYEPGPDGQPAIVEWIAHDGMFRLPENQVLTIYWAPFWGALNQGEQLPASRSLELLAALLKESREKSGRRLFIDQFNFVDNTPGHGNNAVLKPEETAAFLHRSVCVMKQGGVAGYGLWTARDYAENPLHNPAFGYGLEAWTLARREGTPEAALEALPSGDFQLRLADGDALSQQVPPRHGRMPRAGDALPDRVCAEADVTRPGVLVARAGSGAPVELAFDATGRQRRCADIVPVPDEAGLLFSLSLRGGELALREAMVFDHVQYGGLYDLEGRPGPLLEPVRRMNRDFRTGPMPARCESSAEAQPVEG